VKITVIATGFQARDERSRAMARRAEPVEAVREVPALRSVPPPLPADAKPTARREPALVTAPAVQRTPVSMRREPPVYRPDDDQFDIPAFLRRPNGKPPLE